MKYFIIFLMMFGIANAHEMTPAYPKMEPSMYSGVWVAKLKMFNRRQDVEYYQLSVYDEEWNPVEFVSSEVIWYMPYLSRKNIEVYVREKDVSKVTYICTMSKIFRSEKTETVISSTICSKIKRDE